MIAFCPERGVKCHDGRCYSSKICYSTGERIVSWHPRQETINQTKSTAEGLCTQAAQLVSSSRAETHGPKLRNHQNIATMWNAYMAIRRYPGTPLDALDVAEMMSLLKKARKQLGAYNPDDYLDDIGYSAIAGELAADGN